VLGKKLWLERLPRGCVHGVLILVRFRGNVSHVEVAPPRVLFAASHILGGLQDCLLVHVASGGINQFLTVRFNWHLYIQKLISQQFKYFDRLQNRQICKRGHSLSATESKLALAPARGNTSLKSGPWLFETKADVLVEQVKD
jgi:hypothetical protein